VKKQIGNAIRERRKLLQIKQADLADLAQISVNTLYKIERGQANPTVEVLEKLLHTLGLEIDIKIKEMI
jgi:y4mF family transcriptional regulator